MTGCPVLLLPDHITDASVPAFLGWLLFWEQLEQQIKLWRDEEGEDIIHKTIFWWSEDKKNKNVLLAHRKQA